MSIVTLSYDQGQFIEEAIRSVLLHGHLELEYITVNNSSAKAELKRER